GVRTFLELAPGARLTGLVGQILQGRPHDALALDAASGQRSGFVDLATALAWLATAGHDVRMSAWGHADAAALAKPAFTVPIVGANYVKPRPKSPPAPARSLPRPDAPATNGIATPTMNGHRSEPPPPAPKRDPVAPPPAPAVDSHALTQALQVTR